MTDGPVLLRFADLSARGIVRNREQLRRMQAEQGFPAGWMLSPNARVWDLPEVEAWLEERRRASGQGSVAA
jgi:hypothetical protein